MMLELHALGKQITSSLLMAGFAAMTVSAAAAPPRKVFTAGASAAATPAAPLSTAPPSPSAEQIQCAVTTLRFSAKQDWTAYRAAKTCARDSQVQDVLSWRLAIGDRSAGFSDLDGPMQTLAGWPRAALIRQRATAALPRSDIAAPAQVKWLQSQSLDADGTAQLALALMRSNRTPEAIGAARRAFVEGDLSPTSENALWATFASTLPATDVAARVSILQWRGEHSRAKRYFDALSNDARALAVAWTDLAAARDASAYARLSASLQAKPELLFAEMQRLRRANSDEAAARLGARITAADAPASARAALFQERRRLAMRMLANRNPVIAYQLVADSGLDRGEIYADAEWLAGWIALRHLNDAKRAERHFLRLSERVSTPVSLTRAYFWLAQAERAQGRTADADKHLAQAAALPPTFYGRLATGEHSERVEMQPSALALSTDQLARFNASKFVRVLRWMIEAGDRSGIEIMAQHIAAELDNPADYATLAALVRDAGYPGVAVRAAKVGIRRGYFSPAAAYPLADLPQRAQILGPETALVLAIIRQESEWDPGVVSSAGARGLMQLMPATARLVSQRHGMPVQTSRLTTDTDYNITLGAAYLKQLTDEFGGSYVLAIAAYNAGPARVREWIKTNGDPRLASVDTLDWIERVPFAETRNYIQRVMENLQVYRQILAENAVTTTLTEDLDRGARPG